VQGVGFRPFVHRLAREHSISGWVRNDAQGVSIEASADTEQLDAFEKALTSQAPFAACVDEVLRLSDIASASNTPDGFQILESDSGGDLQAKISPDLAVCADCAAELFDPANRRHRYPFINCTNCGPRFSIIEKLPYDRPNTSMKLFKMCAECQAEYDNPHDRRFHAQPNACRQCGPSLQLWDATGRALAEQNDALLAAAKHLRAGRVVAAKGLGGFHLMVDARNPESVLLLRKRKHREEKPFALMYPTLADIRRDCDADELETRLLCSAQAPIVLLRRRREARLAGGVAPRNPYLGVMLPHTPLHLLLLRELGFPVVATSGNLSDEPICTDEREALSRLRGIADFFLVHNRPIIRHMDDSIARVIMGREMVLRGARGFAPLSLRLPRPVAPVLALGAHLKNTVAVAAGRDVFVSQHIGDLDTPGARRAFEQVAGDLQNLYRLKPQSVMCDAHPDYASTQHAKQTHLPVKQVQHHHAHVLACMADNKIQGAALGVAWDGTGYGLDQTVWGGEFLKVSGAIFERVACLRPFKLPGGEKAVREPRRSALGVLFEMFGARALEQTDLAPLKAFAPRELFLLRQALEKGLNTPATTSAGRLFDAVASLAGLCQTIRYEGQAAMELEFVLPDIPSEESYPFSMSNTSSPLLVDWQPLIEQVIWDVARNIAVPLISAKFHNALAEMIVTAARQAGEKTVALAGGCFQNKYLLTRAITRLRQENFTAVWPWRLPPNDGSIAAGQILAACV
jgi:hydrogenase maturation protein HypF